jgi:predicted Zn-dependent protease
MSVRFAMALIAATAVSTLHAATIDQHSVEGIVAAMATPLSAEAVSAAREFDDQLLSVGRMESERVYLTTDERSRKVNGIAERLLTAMGQDPRGWVVRVLDTTPPQNNAFVVGGRYVYVYTGFIAAAQSDDEIAFVLGHELGHSLLKHGERRSADSTQQIVDLIAVIASLSRGKTAQQAALFSEVLSANYSQQDEAEADALGTAIALRAGFDPLRGVDFFTRMVRDNDAATSSSAQTEIELNQARAAVAQAQQTCAQYMNAFKSGQIEQSQQNADQINRFCADAESRRISFNAANESFHAIKAQESLQTLTASHPAEQSRVAALAATVDFLSGRRDLGSLSTYKTANLVMQALSRTDSVLLKPPAASTVAVPKAPVDTAASAPGDLKTRLQRLKEAFDAGLISKDEYDRKREELIRQL